MTPRLKYIAHLALLAAIVVGSCLRGQSTPPSAPVVRMVVNANSLTGHLFVLQDGKTVPASGAVIKLLSTNGFRALATVIVTEDGTFTLPTIDKSVVLISAKFGDKPETIIRVNLHPYSGDLRILLK